MAATHVEKSTVSRGSLNAVSSGSDSSSAMDAAAAAAPAMPEAEGAVCTMRPGDPGFEECEACQ
jgi:ribonucleoside-diphosphate reductase alpha chain